ncbi:MAG: tetratricopeptide repeat protein [Planctomycetes bacterium]|nr:tetratricopeptide repeat protein [Planctomycetota bacterium]
MADFDDSSEERLTSEAEELMRQGRFQDAASCYEELCSRSPTDMWASLGYVSALECAGQVGQAEQVMSDLATVHRHNASIHRFQHLFFERREDYARAILCQEMMQEYKGLDDGPVDQLADLYFNQGRYHEALKELERIYQNDELEDDQLLATVLGRIGACHRQQNNLELARTFLIDALGYDQHNNWLLTEIAETERAEDNYQEAHDYYQKALLEQDSDHFARSRLAQLEFENGNEEQAIEQYNKILEDQPRAYWAMIELAQILTVSDPELSYKLCLDVIDNDATIPAAYSQLGQLARNKGELEESWKHYQEALAVTPDANWILHELADISYQLGRKEEAETHLIQARNNDPFDAITYGVHADFLRNENDLEKAVPFLQKAVELDKGYTWAWRELAEVQALLGHNQEAQEAQGNYAQLEANNAYCDGLQAFILCQDNKNQASIPYLERAVLQQPNYLWAWRELIDFHLQHKQFAQAEEKCREALKHFANNPAFWGMLTESLRQQHKHDEALLASESAVEHGSEIPQLWALHAELYMDHDLEVSIHSAQRARELDSASEYAILHAQCLLAAQKTNEAQTIVLALLDDGHVDSHLFDLASEISIRNEDFDAAVLWCDRGLEQNTENKRLLLRRAILAVDRKEEDAEELLTAAFSIPKPEIWREFILPFAQIGNMANSRRAAYNYIHSSDSSDEQARAWLLLAEAELIQKNTNEAKQSLHESLRIDPQCIPAHLLFGMIAEKHNDFENAAKHLSLVYENIQKNKDDVSKQGHDQHKHIDLRLLLRQLSHIEEQRHQIESARHYLKELEHQSSNQLQYRIDHAAFELRHDDHCIEAEQELLELLNTYRENYIQSRRILHHLSWYYLRSQSAEYAFQWLKEYDEVIDHSNRQLAAQLALAHGAFEDAEEQIYRIADTDKNDQHQLILCRALIGRTSYQQAKELALSIWEAQATHEEAAVLLSEAMAYLGEYQHALEVLSSPQLPKETSDERFFLTACVQLEVHSTSNCLSYIGGKNADDIKDAPLKRILHAAFGSAWGGKDIAAAKDDDVLSLPPFTAALFRLGKALSRNKKIALASQVLVLAYSLAQDNGQKELCKEISAPLVKLLLVLGQKKIAWSYAWQAKSLRLMLRCCF